MVVEEKVVCVLCGSTAGAMVASDMIRVGLVLTAHPDSIRSLSERGN